MSDLRHMAQAVYAFVALPVAASVGLHGWATGVFLLVVGLVGAVLIWDRVR